MKDILGAGGGRGGMVRLAGIPLLLVMLCMGLVACAPQMPTPWPLPPDALPPGQEQAVTAQFSARVLPQAADLPLQGGLRLDAHEGALGVILQHGRTLGQCRMTREGGALRLDCQAAEGLGSRGQQLLQRVAQAVCRVLPQALPPPPSPPPPNDTAHALRRLVYKDTLGEVDIVFSEVQHP